VYGVRSVDLSGEPSSLIGIARPLYAQESFGVDLQETVYALDTTAIDLCLSVFPWAVFRTAKAAIKLHTLLDLRGNIPTFIHIARFWEAVGAIAAGLQQIMEFDSRTVESVSQILCLTKGFTPADRNSAT